MIIENFLETMKKTLLGIIIVTVIIGAGAFYAGIKYDQSKKIAARGTGNFANLSAEERQARMQQAGMANFAGGARGGRAGSGDGFATGEVISKDDKSVTLKLQNGGSQIIFFTPSTPITKSVSGSASDIIVGEQITASGTKNQDGSISAQSIQIRPNIEVQPR